MAKQTLVWVDATVKKLTARPHVRLMTNAIKLNLSNLNATIIEVYQNSLDPDKAPGYSPSGLDLF